MKKIFSLMTAVLLMAVAAIGQSPAPGLFNYQGVARNSVGNVLVNKTISLRLTVHDGTPGGPSVYQETRTVTTNPFGLFNVQVGGPGASSSSGTIPGVNWGVNAKYIQVEIDPNGGSTFINIGTAQIASVPYALYSSLSNDLVLPFDKTQSDAGTLFKVTNSGTGAGSTALEGQTNSTAGNAYAVIGRVTSTGPGGFSTGVRGINNSTSGLGIGVWGSQNGSGWGVYGTAPSGIGGNFSTTSGIGVNAAATTGDGLRSTTNGAFGKFGVFGIATADATGVAGNSGSGIAVLGVSGTGPSGVFQNFTAASTATTLTAFNQGGSGDAFSSVTTGSGRAGFFQNNNAANVNKTVEIVTNGALASRALSVEHSGFGAGVDVNLTNTTNVNNALQVNNLGLGRGALIQSTNAANNANIIDAFNAGTGWVMNISSSNGTPRALRTQGALRFSGINEAANRILTTVPGDGTATWQNPAAVGIVTGSGTLNYVPKWTPNGTNLGNSNIFVDATNFSTSINTTSMPTSNALNVSGGWAEIQQGSTANYPFLYLNSLAASGNGGILFGGSTGGDNGRFLYRTGGDYLSISHRNGGASTNGLADLIVKNGNVGVATTAPTSRFHVENADAVIPAAFVNQTNTANISNALNVLEANITNAAWGNAAIQGRRGTGSGASTYLFGTPTAISGIATTGTSAAGVQGTSDAGIGVAGFSTNGTGVSGINMNSGSAGVFQNLGNTTNPAPVVDVNNISTVANAYGVRSTISNTAPGGFSAALRGINNGTGGLGIGVWGSQNGSGWGVYGTAPTGFGVVGVSTSGVGGRFVSTSGQALYSTGAVRLEGINEAANRILTTVPGDGTATWQDPSAVGIVSGNGALNFLPKWTPNGTTLGNSMFFDDASNANLGGGAGGNRPSSLTIWQTPGTTDASLAFRTALGEFGGMFVSSDGKLHLTSNNADPSLATIGLTIDDDLQSVGIGTTTPVAKMELRNYNSTLNNFTTPSGFTGATGIGVADATVESSFKTSIYAFADGAAGSNISVWGDAGTTSNTGNAGLFGRVSLTPTGTGFSTGLFAFDVVNGPNTWAAIIRGRLQYQDGTQGADKVLTSDMNGNASWVGRVAFRAIGYSGGAITLNTDLIVDNVVYDDASGYNATTGQFTAPVAGLYHFDAGMRGSNANIGRTNLCFISNLQGFFSCSSVDVTASNQSYSAVNINGDILLAAGEIVTVRVEPISGSYTPLNSSNYIYFNGHRVR
ncbi:MAG TPA: hypothetical protein PK275_08890 [Chitinophagaceae bacterium]|nr:hypothetical protein [Chitinophagaceae bacterium]